MNKNPNSFFIKFFVFCIFCILVYMITGFNIKITISAVIFTLILCFVCYIVYEFINKN